MYREQYYKCFTVVIYNHNLQAYGMLQFTAYQTIAIYAGAYRTLVS
jgi:hypothetical protein